MPTTKRRSPRPSTPGRSRTLRGPRAVQRRPTSRSDDAGVAGDIMTRRIITVAPSTPLSEIARILSENRISGVPVVNTRGKAIGVVSLRDLIDRYVEDPDTRPRGGRGYFRLSTEELLDEDFDAVDVPSDSEDKAEDIMNPEIVGVPADTPLREVAATMARRSVHRVLVTDSDDGSVLGIVASLDVLGALAGLRRNR